MSPLTTTDCPSSPRLPRSRPPGPPAHIENTRAQFASGSVHHRAGDAPAAGPGISSVTDMTRTFSVALVVVMASASARAGAQAPPVLPSPLGLGDVVRLATERRDEIQPAGGRRRAGEARASIGVALEEP